MLTSTNPSSHTVPLIVKIICSIFLWLPIIISFITIWYYPHITIIYNIFISIYIIISNLLMYGTCFLTFIKQKDIIHRFFKSVEWDKIKNDYAKCKKLGVTHDIEDILHMVVIPIYNEDPIIIENTLKSLSKQNVSMIIGFALEEREMNSDTKYNTIIDKYENIFIKIIKTIHPMDFKNEVAGKASNCNYCSRILIKFYEENNINLKNRFNHVMITSCDADSIWANDYFLYFNYLCTTNGMENFNRTVYAPNITNLKHFQSSHMFSNWMSTARSIGIHGHFRFLGYIRTFVSEYHIPLQLLKRIDYWDTDFVHEDIHMYNKLAILDDQNSLMFKHTLLPCNNQIPTNINSFHQTFLLLWNQTLRWNLFTYDLYYLSYELFLHIFQIKRYEHFRTNRWKMLIQIVNNYENLFFFMISPISNNIFWILYLYFFQMNYYKNIIYYILFNIQPYFLITQMILPMLYASFIFTAHDQNTNGKPYNWGKHVFFLLGFIPFPLFFFAYQGITITIAWIETLKSTGTHLESAPKIIS